ncbi:MAG TPA: M28 family peptidase [Gemmatimonadales bacterium]|nr:M28 family peptidase [Gemmatimonadales bacterium]
MLLLVLSACAGGAPGGTPSPAVTAAEISPADLRARLGAYAHDSMLGRRSGTLGGVKATDFIAAEVRRLGLEPAGENGTYFQTVPMVTRTIDPAAGLTADGITLEPWDDLLPRDQGRGTRPVDGAAAVYGGVWGDSTRPLLPREQAAGKLVVLTAAPTAQGTPTGIVARAAVSERFAGAAGVVVVTLDNIGHTERRSLVHSGAALAGISGLELPAFMYATRRAGEALLGTPLDGLTPGAPGRVVRGQVRFVDSPAPFPVRNVVARLPGSDPKLRGELVAIGAHHDHEGIADLAEEHDSLRAFNRVMRPEGANNSPGKPTAEQAARITRELDSLRRARPARVDSVLNGADDDGSGTVAVLEIAELLARGPARPRRSVLFVWHAAEELSLLGSDWFTREPTVPRDSIVAQLNIDMVGRGMPDDLARGGPGYLQLIGSRRLSTELGDAVDRVNRDGKHGFQFDYSYDADGHPDNYYCRSDHAMYARYGIPVAFFSTGSHRDYHQLTDEAQYIDYDKLSRVTRFIAGVAMAVGDMEHRPVVDKPKPDPMAPCKQ